MKILKKSSAIQPYDPDKIVLTLERTSDEVAQPLTEGDLRRLTEQITRRVVEMGKSQDPLPSGCVHVIVVATLRENGFPAIAQAYYDANAYR